MSIRSRSYLSLLLVLSLSGACGAEGTSPGGDDSDETDDISGDETDEDDDVGTDDDEEDAGGDEDDDEDDDGPVVTPPPVGMKDGGAPPVSGRDGGKDAGSTSDAGKDAGPKTDSGPAAGGDGGTGGPTAPPMGTGECCSDGDCICREAPPSALTSDKGKYKTAELRIGAGTVVYPTDAEPPFAAVAICGGFLNTGPEMASWGPFYASHGIVTVITSTGAADIPDIRATKLLAAIEQLKAENTKSGSPLEGKLAGRYGTSGYSMGGGGTTIASGKEASLKTSVGLAPWGGSGSNVKVPTLLLCGASDSTAPCSMAQSVYRGIAETTPKMMFNIPGTSHFNWFGPTDAGRGLSGQYALAFQKVFLEGDERWKPLLTTKPSSGTMTSNIQ